MSHVLLDCVLLQAFLGCALTTSGGLHSARRKKAETQSAGDSPPPPLPPPSPCLSSGEFTQSQGLWPSGIYPLGVHPGMATILTWCWSIGRQASLLPAPGPFRPGAPLLFLCHFLEKWESPSCFLVMLEYGNCCGCDILSFSLWVYPLLQNPPIRNLIMSPPNSYIDTLTPNETVYGDRAFKEIIRVKCGPKGGALIQ